MKTYINRFANTKIGEFIISMFSLVGMMVAMVVFCVGIFFVAAPSVTALADVPNEHSEGWYEIMTDYEPGLAVREEACVESELLCRLPSRTEVYITDFCNGWGYTHAKCYAGWVYMKYTKAITWNNTECNLDVPPADNGGNCPQALNTDLYKEWRSFTASDYVLQESNCTYLSVQDLEKLTSKGLCYARNEIYARHGRIYSAGELNTFFRSRTWYKAIYEPTLQNDEIIVELMNDYEKYNLQLILAEESRRGEYNPS